MHQSYTCPSLLGYSKRKKKEKKLSPPYLIGSHSPRVLTGKLHLLILETRLSRGKQKRQRTQNTGLNKKVCIQSKGSTLHLIRAKFKSHQIRTLSFRAQHEHTIKLIIFTHDRLLVQNLCLQNLNLKRLYWFHGFVFLLVFLFNIFKFYLLHNNCHLSLNAF